MIAFIEGQISDKNPTYVVLDTGGIGYLLHISLNTYARLESLERVKLLTHLHIKEDSHTLFGFWTEEERTMFRHLISVSGIGPSTAQLILSAMQTSEIRSAIVSEDVNTFKRVKGIGAKTAQRLIIDLKDKVARDGEEIALIDKGTHNTLREEALSALVSLGFPRPLVSKTLNQVMAKQSEGLDLEHLIKMVLKELS
jgi:Holliday junction DNA helicase RuvA